MLHINLTILKCSYHIDIECILSYVLRIVFASILRVALSLAPSLKLTALMRVFGVGGILPEACWYRRPFNTCFKNILI